MALLSEATWTDLPERPLVLIPLGSTEQHGPHLPLGTDTLIATAVAHKLASRGNSHVAPAVAIGASGEHQDFPGVLSIGTDALRLLLIELVRSLSLWAGRIVFVNGHGGNLEAVTSAVGQLTEEGHDVSWVPCSVAGDGHAGHTETSLLLHLAPWLVRPSRVEAGNTRPVTELLPALRARGVRAVSPNGVLGDPTHATAAAGAGLFQQMVETARRGL
jgi:mycofactocin system creatininase family protein